VLELRDPAELPFHAGQYVDIRVPGTEWSRSFSMSSTPATAGRLEFLIKVYPLEVQGPYGTFTLRERSQADLLFVGGGAGMAPILSVLRSLAEQDSTRRATFYYGARTRSDLFLVAELEALTERLPGLDVVFALSEPTLEDAWTGECGLITDVVARRETDLEEREAYLCGPPPMVEAGIDLLTQRGVPEERLHFDKFTTTASAEETGG
jgi:propane monooxygenase reductase subunit